MILFDLKCGDGHVFEGWFGSSADYTDQQNRGMITCPICNNSLVTKAVMAPNIGVKSNQRSGAAPKSSQDAKSQIAAGSAAPQGEAAPVALAKHPANLPDLPPRVREILHNIAEKQAESLKTSTYVGQNFAEEARAIHYGETDDRAIHGEATPDEARDLHAEGIAVMPLLVQSKPRATHN